MIKIFKTTKQSIILIYMLFFYLFLIRKIFIKNNCRAEIILIFQPTYFVI